ncbi:hypothetical protein HY990_04815 [Candidatus Micrarchaeota archaeon]|nr:hypothetical protein [Candidatus Micrarchaeota archaeon]
MILSQHNHAIGVILTDNQYKPIDNVLTKQIKNDLDLNLEKFKDPIVLAEMVYRLLEERENTNRILKTLLQKIETIEARYDQPMPVHQEEIKTESGDILLPEVDEQIMQFIKISQKATAEDVRAKFNYKGKNAASARLNRLCDMNLLKKAQVGKKVYFFPT